MSEATMKKQALLIGINEYPILPKLNFARQDAEAVEESLKQNYCFSDNEVMLLTDAKPGLLKPINRRVIEKHLEKLADQELDLFIFGFWGHGLFRNGQRYFCPLDAISEDIEELGLSFSTLQRLLSNIKAKNTCMILDCCQKVHDRGESETLTAADQTVMENVARDIVLRRKEKEPGFQSNVAILNSCKEGQSAYEWDARRHGLFTAHLLDAMRMRSASVMQIASYISSNIERTALELGKEQTPFYKLEGDIQLPVSTEQVADAPAPPQPKPESREVNNPLAGILAKEMEKNQKALEALQKEAAEAFCNEEFAIAISKCEAILKLEPNSVEAKALLPLCQSKLEFQKAELKRKEEEQRKSKEEQERKAQEEQLRKVEEEQRKAEEKRKRQEAEVILALSVPGTNAGERKTITVNGVEFAFRWAPAGSFVMGSPLTESGRYVNEIQHQVTLTNGFWITETLVTQIQWFAIMGNNPSNFKGEALPVERVSWFDCQEFCKQFAQSGLPVHLPTEAQWEYACRAGSTTAYFWGNDLNGDRANCDGNYPCGTTVKGKYIRKTTPVGIYPPNAWGLYDMHGNVFEWCQDWFGDYPDGSVTDPAGPSSGSNRVIRGGGWCKDAQRCRSAYRSYHVPTDQYSLLGFRLVRSITSPEN